TIELGDAQLLDLLLAADAELLLHLDLDRQAVRVPTGLAQHVEPLLRAMPGEQVLDRARKHVMDTGLAVRGRWTLEEDEAPGGVARFQRALEEPLGPPLRQQLALEIVRPPGLRDLGVF